MSRAAVAVADDRSNDWRKEVYCMGVYEKINAKLGHMSWYPLYHRYGILCHAW